jgi:hypothetical protein
VVEAVALEAIQEVAGDVSDPLLARLARGVREGEEPAALAAPSEELVGEVVQVGHQKAAGRRHVALASLVLVIALVEVPGGTLLTFSVEHCALGQDFALPVHVRREKLLCQAHSDQGAR